jgi:hypothetical protein
MIQEVLIVFLFIFIFISFVSAQEIVSDDFSVDSFTLGSVGDSVSEGDYDFRYISLVESGGYFEGDVYGEVKRYPSDVELIVQDLVPSDGDDGGSDDRIVADFVLGDLECRFSSDCKFGFTCFEGECYKIFDIKILDIDSLARKGEFFEFTYLVTRFLNQSGEAKASYWIDGEDGRLIHGYDNIHLKPYSKITSVQKVLLPRDVSSGSYNFSLLVESNNMDLKIIEDIFIRDMGDFVRINEKVSWWFVFGMIFISGLAVLIVLSVVFKKRVLFAIYLFTKKISSRIYYFVKSLWRLRRRLKNVIKKNKRWFG